MSAQSSTLTRITLTLRAADGQTLEPIQPFVQISAHVSIGRGLAVIDLVQQPALGGELPAGLSWDQAPANAVALIGGKVDDLHPERKLFV